MRNASSSEATVVPPLSMAEVFQKTLRVLEVSANSGTFQASLTNEEQLQLYGLYKQATRGDCDEPTPSRFNFKAYLKHQAWEKRQGQTKMQSAREYVECVIEFSADVDGLEDMTKQIQDFLAQGAEEDEKQESEPAPSSTVPADVLSERQKPSVSDSSIPTNIFGGLLATFFKVVITDLLGIPPLFYHGHLDMDSGDLCCAAWQCLRAFNDTKQQQLYREKEAQIVHHLKKALTNCKRQGEHKEPSVLVGLSAPTLLDLYLRVKQYPAGSEIIVSPPVMVSGMMHVLQHHQLKTVAIDLPEPVGDEVVVAADCEAIGLAVSSKTVAIIVAHAYGMIVASDEDFKRVRAIASQDGRSIDVIEACMEAFPEARKSDTYLGSPCADISLFSFGHRKTMASLNAAVAVLREFGGKDNASTVKAMVRLHNSSHYDPQQTNKEFLRDVVVATMFRFITDSPPLFGLVFFIVSHVFGMDFDWLVKVLWHGFDESEQKQSASGNNPTNNTLFKIRRRPSPALVALLHSRLRRFSLDAGFSQNKSRLARSRQLSETLAKATNESSRTRISPKVRGGSIHHYWLYPVLAEDPSHAIKHFRRHGFDATKVATHYRCIAGSEDPCSRAARLVNETLYLPLERCSDGQSATVKNKLVHAAETLGSQADPSPTKNRNSIVVPITVVTLAFFAKAFLMGGLRIYCYVFLFISILLWFICWSLGDVYLNSTRAFAKYSHLLGDDFNSDKGWRIDAVEGAEELEATPILSTMSTLTVPSHIDSSSGPRSVFLTGSTGFVGSMLLHHLLLYRKRLNIDRVILLCRPKRGKSAKDRIAGMLDGAMYSFMSAEEKLSMVEVFEGDVSMANAGLAEDDIEVIRLQHNVSHVIHSAADISFTQSIKDAGAANITSALTMQDLASRLSKEPVQFVHISTAFVHGGLSGDETDPLPEDLFSFGRFDPVQIYESICGTQFYAYKAMAELQFPNTYTFTKSVCEHLLIRNDPRTLIVRPSIVGPAVESPREGWTGQIPSAITSCFCLYLSTPFNLWSLPQVRSPLIPVDVLSRYVIAKTFSSDVLEEASSDGSYKIVSHSLSTCTASSSSSSSSTQGHRIFTAAFNDESPDSSFFSWSEVNFLSTQISAILEYHGRSWTIISSCLYTSLLPKLSLSCRQFQKLHFWFVLYPFDIFVRACKAVGKGTRNIERLRPFLDLPCLLFHFTNNQFHFQSELVAPDSLDGERYLVSNISGAHQFWKTVRGRMSDQLIEKEGKAASGIAFFRIAGSAHHRAAPGILWALTQPRGNFLIRFVGWFLGKVLHKCFSEVTVDLSSFVPTQHARESCCVVLAPTHRSFFDFLLLSYLAFAIPELQIAIPLIAAADEFERLPFIGWMIQYLGAFYIQRGRVTRDPALLETIASVRKRSGDKGTIGVFVEGARSRDRRFINPKTGVLRCLFEAGGDCVVVPIAISYERLAEQTVLASETAGGTRERMSVGGMFSWVTKAMRGQVELGRAHIAACKPLKLHEGSEHDWDGIARDIQQRQAEQMLISDYHLDAVASVLDLEPRVVQNAFSKLDVKFFPSCGAPAPSPASTMTKPGNDCESLSLLFQASPYIAPLLRTSKPEWSKWLSRPSCCEPTDGILQDHSVALITTALVGMFDAADHCVQTAVSRLNENGYSQPNQRHVLQEATRNQIPVPASLVWASITRQYSDDKRPISIPTVSPLKSTARIVRKLIGNTESLGFWGFHDSAFVVRADESGRPFVSVDGKRYTLAGKKITKLLPFIESETGMKIDPLQEAFLGRDDSRPVCSVSQLSKKDMDSLMSSVSVVSTKEEDRIRHGTGHCQEDVFAIRSGKAIRVPDAVVWPASEDEVVNVVVLAQENRWCIVPFGGGTNVTQATRCPPIEVEPRPIISLDMRRMDSVCWINEENGVAKVEAGITGRKLEEELSLRGYTMGHEPDSIEFSTLGGWIATKASGMKRSKYGNIEDIVMSVRVAGPDGILQHGKEERHVWGRESSGVDLRGIIFGSEGCLGVVTSAIVRIQPIAEAKDYDSIMLPDFETGLSFVRQVAKLGGKLPASVRLLDNEHFRLGLALRPEKDSQFEAVFSHVVTAFVKWKNGFETKKVVCATITYEGTHAEVKEQKRVVTQIGLRHGGVRLGSEVGKSGYDLTYMIAYLRDFAMTYYFLGESFETFVPWSEVEAVIERTKARIRREHDARHLPGSPFIGCRVTQLYHEGACLYFYFCMNFENVDNASEVYTAIEHAAREEVIASGGSVSHHHGVGKVRSQFLKEVDSPALQHAMTSVKNGLDPENIFGARNGSFASS